MGCRESALPPLDLRGRNIGPGPMQPEFAVSEDREALQSKTPCRLIPRNGRYRPAMQVRISVRSLKYIPIISTAIVFGLFRPAARRLAFSFPISTL